MAVSEQTQSAGTLQAVPVCFLSGQASPCAFGCALQLNGHPTPCQHSFCPALSLFLLALLLLSRGSVLTLKLPWPPTRAKLQILQMCKLPGFQLSEKPPFHFLDAPYLRGDRTRCQSVCVLDCCVVLGCLLTPLVSCDVLIFSFFLSCAVCSSVDRNSVLNPLQCVDDFLCVHPCLQAKARTVQPSPDQNVNEPLLEVHGHR